MPEKALEGVKVADFTWVGVGPVTTKYLADHGATVVRVESTTRTDILRRLPPYKDEEPGVDRSGFFANFNTNKWGLTLNLSTPKGIQVAKRLIAWADIVAENFSPGAMGKWGLDYESVKKIKADIIYYSASSQGQGGPHGRMRGFGDTLVSLTGLTHITGWPDVAPTPPHGAYTDFIAPRFGAVSILAALDYRRRTGKGQHLDLSQLETALQFIGPLILDCSVNGRIFDRVGNSDPYAAPHGAYPCQGEDRWCVIAVYTDEEWNALCKVMGNPPWSRDDKFSTLSMRKENQEELDKLIGGWSKDYTPEQVMQTLQKEGVAAGVVQRPSDLFSDPQLAHRRHFVVLNHREIGPHAYDGIPFHLSETPGELARAAPCIGQDNEYVLKEILGMSDEEVAELVVTGALE